MMRTSRVTSFGSFVAYVAFVSILVCASQSANADEADRFQGTWRATLTSPGGELPFGLEIDTEHSTAHVINGIERVAFSRIAVDGNEILLEWDWYDSRIVANIDEAGESLTGTWSKAATLGKTSSLPFRAVKGDHPRFPAAPGSDTTANVSGNWRVTFRDEGGEEEAVGQFTQTGRDISGTFLTATGDYRFLDGSMDGGTMRLSTFDGAHAFLFDAQLGQYDSLTGNFWSRDSYHATWKGQRIANEDELAKILPNEWETLKQSDADSRFQFRFPDANGKMINSSDERFKNKVILVNVFGTWCPNCHDEAPILAKWHRDHKDKGLEIVGIAFELSGDSQRDNKMLKHFADRHEIEYPLLLGGVSDKAKAAEALPFISKVIAYPTTFFVGRDGKIAYINSGFSGPGTEQRHHRLVEAMESRLRELLEK